MSNFWRRLPAGRVNALSFWAVVTLVAAVVVLIVVTMRGGPVP